MVYVRMVNHPFEHPRKVYGLKKVRPFRISPAPIICTWVSEACSQISSFASPPSFLLSCSSLVPNPPSTRCAFGVLHKRKRKVFLTQEFGSLRKAKDRRKCI